MRLSNKSFSADAAALIANRLSSFKSLTAVDISDIIAGRHEDEALLVLKTICSSMAGLNLLEVNVSDNAFGLKGLDACRDVLVSKVTEKFYFCNNGLSAEAVEGLANILVESDAAPPIKLLHFYNNMAGDGGAFAMSRIIRACPELEDLRFSATRSMAAGCNAIAQAIDSLSSIRCLDLSDTNFGEDAGAGLARALQHQPLLTVLNLRDAGLPSRSVSALFSSLSSTPFPSLLKVLDISGNDLTSEDCEGIAGILGNLASLEELLLDDNDIESEGANTLAEALNVIRKRKEGPTCSLRMISVCTCSITAYGALKLARAVSKIDTFTTLNINGNEILEEYIPTLESILHEMGKTLGSIEDNDGDGEDDAGSAVEGVESENEADTAVVDEDHTAVDSLTSNMQKASI